MRVEKQREVWDKMEKDGEVVRKWYKNEPEAQVKQKERKKAPKTPPKKQKSQKKLSRKVKKVKPKEGEPAEGKETLSKAETRMKMDSDSHSSLRFFDTTKFF